MYSKLQLIALSYPSYLQIIFPLELTFRVGHCFPSSLPVDLLHIETIIHYKLLFIETIIHCILLFIAI